MGDMPWWIRKARSSELGLVPDTGTIEQFNIASTSEQAYYHAESSNAWEEV
jgi:hypothetical protein